MARKISLCQATRPRAAIGLGLVMSKNINMGIIDKLIKLRREEAI